MYDHIATARTYYIAGDGGSVLHYGILEPGGRITTGQPSLWHSEDRAEWVARCVAAGLDADTLPSDPPSTPSPSE
jgi:hypothetical protein